MNSSVIPQQIKDRISAVELISEYLTLQRSGSNYKALCPFHTEKTPSFMVSPERNFWYCFGCQKGGDIFTFIMEMEGIAFRDALERLADRAGIELPRFVPMDPAERNQKKTIQEILETATVFFQNQLVQHPRGAKARTYLADRGLTADVIDRFRIGYASPEWQQLDQFLKQKGYRDQDIAAAGLILQRTNDAASGSNAGWYDRFRDRIMFPVIDINGGVIGYSARVMPGSDESQAKYINTPQTAVYDKSQVLFGLYQGRSAIKQQDSVVVVEGNMDVIASHVAGVEHVVAVSGTALTEQHVRLIKRYTNQILLCFDQDRAGQMATSKSIQTCLRQGAEVYVIELPAGMKDVGDVVQRDAAQWQTLSHTRMAVMEYFFSIATKQFDPNEVTGKKRIAQFLLNILKDIADPIEQSYWLKKLSSLIQVDEAVLTKVLEQSSLKKDTASNTEKQSDNRIRHKPRKIVLQERLLGLFSLFPEQLAAHRTMINEMWFDQEYRALWDALGSGQSTMHADALNHLALTVQYHYDQTSGATPHELDPVNECETITQELKQSYQKERMKRISWDIRRAEQQSDTEAMELLLGELAKLTQSSEDSSR